MDSESNTGEQSGEQGEAQDPSLLGGDKAPAKEPEAKGEAPAGEAGDGSGEGEQAQEKSEPNAAGDVPEGEYDINLPEGMEDMPLDEGLAAKAQPVMKELGLTQEGADKLVALLAEARAEQAQKLTDAFTQQREQWMKDLKNDPEVGGDKFDENVGVALRGIEAFGGDELKNVMNQTGVGNHPVLVKAFYKIGLTVKEDQPGVGSNVGGENVEDTFYKDTTPASGS